MDRVDIKDLKHEANESEPKKSPWDLNDILGKLEPKKPSDSTEKKPEKFSETELAKVTKTSADLILKNEDFGYGPKKERLADIFRDAANKGPEAVKQLSDSINAELAKRNSALRIEGKYDTESETVDKATYPKNGEAIYIHPQIYKDTYAAGNFTLKDSKSGSVEDSMSVRGKLLSSESTAKRLLIDPSFKIEFPNLNRPSYLEGVEKPRKEHRSDPRLAEPYNEKIRQAIGPLEIIEKKN